MDLHSLYFSANGWLSVVTMLSSLLCISDFCAIYGKVKYGKELQFTSDILLVRLSRDARKIVAILFHLLMIVILMFGSNYFIVRICGSTDIRCMPEGTYCYYVRATNEKGKTYTLPAKIYKHDLSTYAVENVYFDNGGYLYFAGTCEDFEYDDTEQCSDQDEHEWEISLTNYKTTHKKVTETQPKWSSDDTLRVVTMLLHLSVIVTHILYWKPKEDI